MLSSCSYTVTEPSRPSSSSVATPLRGPAPSGTEEPRERLARLPEWARKRAPLGPAVRPVRILLREQGLNTVCEEARCPNLGECFARGTATFMLLGDRCTRRCRYCAVATARPQPPDPGEPARVARAAARLRLRYVVLTSVDRDDLPDGGAAHFARTVGALRAALPEAAVEVLTPDFAGDRTGLRVVLDSAPTVFNHNIETVPRLFPHLRPQGRYPRSLELLRAAKELRPGQETKSGLMVGLGETDEEVEGVLRDLRGAGVDAVTIGQYLQPTRRHEPVHRYLPPARFPRPRADGPRPGLRAGLLGRLRALFLQRRGAAPRGGGPLIRWRDEGLAVVSGLLLFLSFPKFGTGLLGWVALAPLLVAICGSPPGRALRLSYLSGAVSSLGLLYWTALVVVQYGGIALPIGIAIMVALCLAFSIFYAIFGWAVGRLTTAFGGVGLLGAPFVWVALEYARAHTFFSFPWCLLGYSQHAQLPFIQIASLTAVYGVSFLLAASASLLALAAVERRTGWRRGALVAVLVLVGGSWLFGRWAMSVPVRETGRIRVGLVQGGIRQEDKWVPENAWENIDRHLDLAEQAADRGARLVVWPESAVPFLFDENVALASRLRALTRRRGIFLFFGNDDLERPAFAASGRAPGRGRIYVGAKLLDPSGRITARYRKIRLVPFGEYVPLHSLFTVGGRFAAKLVQEVSDFTPGTEATTGRVDGHAIGGFICYEAIFPGLVRRFAAEGAELLVNITNDAWYGTTSAPYQHLAMASFRAVENRRYLVRAANTGITAVVDPWGRVREKTRLFEATVLVAEVPFVSGTTFYTRHGDLFARICLALALALVAATLRSRGPKARGTRGRSPSASFDSF